MHHDPMLQVLSVQPYCNDMLEATDMRKLRKRTPISYLPDCQGPLRLLLQQLQGQALSMGQSLPCKRG
jgi:hypothetical protein